MNRFKLMMMSMNRFRLLLFTTCVVAITVLISGISVTYAQTPSTVVPPAVAAANKAHAEAAAARAKAKRAEMLKQRAEARKYIKSVVEGQQSQGAAGADNAGKGVAQ